MDVTNYNHALYGLSTNLSSYIIKSRRLLS